MSDRQSQSPDPPFAVAGNLDRLCAAFEQAFDDALLVAQPDWTVEYVNAAFETLTGWAGAQAVGKPLDETFLRADRDRALLVELRESGSRGAPWRGHIAFAAADGAQRVARAVFQPLSDGEGQCIGFALSMRDATYRNDLETRLRQSHKMRALGTLVGGIAHDFNNILQTILGYASLLADATKDNSRSHRYVQEISDAGDRAAELVGQIQNFSHQTEHEPLPILLQPIVKETLKLLRDSVAPRIAVHLAVDTRCGHVLADPTQIHEMLLELCTNALEAMHGDGGTLTVGLDELEAAPPAQPVPAPGRYVRLTIADTGPGLNDEQRNRLLSSQPPAAVPGPSQGRGLAIVRDVLDRHEAGIVVSAAHETGTTLQIYLPRCLPQSAIPAPHEASPTWRMGGRVLFVDDEVTVARMGKVALESFGFQVSSHTHSPSALDEFRTDPYRYDIVVTDEVMPELTGSIMAREMLRMRPGLPVIVCSGYPRRIEELQSETTGVRVFMRKPFLAAELARHIRALLKEQRDTAGPHIERLPK